LEPVGKLLEISTSKETVYLICRTFGKRVDKYGGITEVSYALFFPVILNGTVMVAPLDGSNEKNPKLV
jgi:hypothetical protein